MVFSSPRAFRCKGCNTQLANDESTWLQIAVSSVGTLLGFGVLFIYLFFGWWGILLTGVTFMPLMFLPAYFGSLRVIDDTEIRRRNSFALLFLGLLALAVIVAGIVEEF